MVDWKLKGEGLRVMTKILERDKKLCMKEQVKPLAYQKEKKWVMVKGEWEKGMKKQSFKSNAKVMKKQSFEKQC